MRSAFAMFGTAHQVIAVIRDGTYQGLLDQIRPAWPTLCPVLSNSVLQDWGDTAWAANAASGHP